jgi:hypothetical protein
VNARETGLLTRALRARFPVSPDPWPAEIDAAVKDATAEPLCINCLYPQAPHQWFCPHCNYPTGDCVPLMHYLQIFPMGELLRRGVMGPPERRAGVQFFLIVFSTTQYALFAPVYWYWMARRASGRPIGFEVRRDLPEEISDSP